LLNDQSSLRVLCIPISPFLSFLPLVLYAMKCLSPLLSRVWSLLYIYSIVIKKLKKLKKFKKIIKL
jgi:hypothetical protein